MLATLLLALALASDPEEPPWQDLALSIEKDATTSSDLVTLCRVRVVNHGSHTWPGSRVQFEAVALEGGAPMARERGRFGLSLSPHGTLETVIAFHGVYNRFEVRPVFKENGGSRSKSRGGARTKPKQSKKKNKPPS
jgi:hypothetical protein